MKNILTPILLILAIGLITVAARLPFEATHKTADVNVYQGIAVFTDCTPLLPYDNIGDVTVKSTGGWGNDTYNSKRQSAINKMKQQFPNADGILISFKENGAVNATAIKFK